MKTEVYNKKLKNVPNKEHRYGKLEDFRILADTAYKSQHSCLTICKQEKAQTHGTCAPSHQVIAKVPNCACHLYNINQDISRKREVTYLLNNNNFIVEVFVSHRDRTQIPI